MRLGRGCICCETGVVIWGLIKTFHMRSMDGDKIEEEDKRQGDIIHT